MKKLTFLILFFMSTTVFGKEPESLRTEESSSKESEVEGDRFSVTDQIEKDVERRKETAKSEDRHKKEEDHRADRNREEGNREERRKKVRFEKEIRKEKLEEKTKKDSKIAQ